MKREWRKPGRTCIFLARMARESGLNGIVASPRKPMIQEIGDDFVIVTPEFGLVGRFRDQQRILTPRRAIENGASYLVIGRPIIEHSSPREAAEKFLPK